jgi:hypothetical protein
MSVYGHTAWVGMWHRHFGMDHRSSRVSREPRSNLVVGKLRRGAGTMLDFLMIVYGVGFFVLSIFYVLACEKM